MNGEEGFTLHPLAARRVREEIHNRIRELVSLPSQGYRRPDLTSRPLLFTRVRDYLIAYAPNEKPLWVVAVNIGAEVGEYDFEGKRIVAAN